jgi:pilus assembly protein FimV
MFNNGFVVEEAKQASDTANSRKLRTGAIASGASENTASMPTVKPGAEQSDPISEADFHMAYGLYDQAADLIRLAIQRDPGRRDLKLKLLEIFFVWGNKPEFIALATELSQSRAQGQPGEWDKVLIMGRQLAPEAALFDTKAAAATAVDHNLEGGQNLVDFDLVPGAARQDDSPLDFDLGTPEPDGDTRLMPRGAEARKKPEGTGNDKTQELTAFDSMGLDLGSLDTAHVAALEDSQLEKALGLGDSTALMQGLDDKTVHTPVQDIALGSSDEWQLLDANAETLGVGDTQIGAAPAVPKASDRNLVETSSRLQPFDGDAPGSTQQLEPPSLSEIGTKLDLARAYIDMGDPDGARSILAEVLAEGNDGQKQEAQRLLDAIPG